MSPHKFYIIKREFNNRTGQFYERVISRHKSEQAAKDAMKFYRAYNCKIKRIPKMVRMMG